MGGVWTRVFLTDAAHPTPHPSRFARHLPLKGKAFGLCESLLHSKSQRSPPLAGNIGLLALVHTTRLTGGYDFLFGNVQIDIPRRNTAHTAQIKSFVMGRDFLDVQRECK